MTSSSNAGEDHQRRAASRTCRSGDRRAARTGTARTSRPRCRRRTRSSASSPAAACRTSETIRLNEQPARPKPINTPADRSSMPGVVACAIMHEAGAYSSAPTMSTRMRAEAVGDRARERLHRRPRSASGSRRETRTRRGPSVVRRHRRQEEAEGRARPEADHARSGSRRRR